jgi:hypothetical protein
MKKVDNPKFVASSYVELSSFAVCELQTDVYLVDGPAIVPAKSEEFLVPALSTGNDLKVSEKWRWRPGTNFLTTYKGTVSKIKQPQLRWKDIHRRC